MLCRCNCNYTSLFFGFETVAPHYKIRIIEAKLFTLISSRPWTVFYLDVERDRVNDGAFTSLFVAAYTIHALMQNLLYSMYILKRCVLSALKRRGSVTLSD